MTKGGTRSAPAETPVIRLVAMLPGEKALTVLQRTAGTGESLASNETLWVTRHPSVALNSRHLTPALAISVLLSFILQNVFF